MGAQDDSPSPHAVGHFNGTHSEWLHADLWVLEDRFAEIGRFFNIIEKAHDEQTKVAVETCRRMPSSAWDHGQDPFGDEMLTLTSSRRIACASTLLTAYAVVEATLRGSYFRVVEELKRRNAVTPEDAEGLITSFKKQRGLGKMVKQLRRFESDRQVRVEASKFKGWKMVEDMRVLCNAFKHRDGIVEWTSEKELSVDDRRIVEITRTWINDRFCSQDIDEDLRRDLRDHLRALDTAAAGRLEVDFEELNVRGYISSAQEFCREVLTAVARLMDEAVIRP